MEFPEKYDLRDHGLVTDVKFQNPWGTCWAFGAVGSLESNALIILKNRLYGFHNRNSKTGMRRMIRWRARLCQEEI